MVNAINKKSLEDKSPVNFPIYISHTLGKMENNRGQ